MASVTLRCWLIWPSAPLRRKIPDLTLALAGRLGEHHGVLCELHLAHIDHLNAMIGRLDARIGELTVPFTEAQRRLMSIPGIGEHAARAIIGEIGTDMSRFATAAHLASWAGCVRATTNRPASIAVARPGTATPTCAPFLLRRLGPPTTPTADSVPGCVG